MPFLRGGHPEDKLGPRPGGGGAAKVFLVVGSSLAVRPAGALPERALLRGARLIIVNDAPTRLERKSARRISGKSGRNSAAPLQGVME